MNINWNKSDGLVPAIIQDATSGKLLMLGYMNAESLKRTQDTGQVTFYSRSRQAIWVKGETSGNSLAVVEIRPDCDNDALLIRVSPAGPVCHRLTESCFDGELEFLLELQTVIKNRISQKTKGSYVSRLVESGTDRVAQKVGEEAVETVIASKNASLSDFENEASDLLFHLMLLLECKGTSLTKIVRCLEQRHSVKKNEPPALG